MSGSCKKRVCVPGQIQKSIFLKKKGKRKRKSEGAKHWPGLGHAVGYCREVVLCSPLPLPFCRIQSYLFSNARVVADHPR